MKKLHKSYKISIFFYNFKNHSMGGNQSTPKHPLTEREKVGSFKILEIVKLLTNPLDVDQVLRELNLYFQTHNVRATLSHCPNDFFTDEVAGKNLVLKKVLSDERSTEGLALFVDIASRGEIKSWSMNDVLFCFNTLNDGKIYNYENVYDNVTVWLNDELCFRFTDLTSKIPALDTVSWSRINLS